LSGFQVGFGGGGEFLSRLVHFSFLVGLTAFASATRLSCYVAVQHECIVEGMRVNGEKLLRCSNY
jgi:hypothetical protein